jgi:hypothetical protein
VSLEQGGHTAAANARRRHRGITKFLTNPEPEPASESLGSQIARQQAKVETARLTMMEVMKKHNIVDHAPLSDGQNFTSVQTPGISMMDDARKYQNMMEQEVSKLTVQLETLVNLKGERLIAGFQELNVKNSTITKVYPEYRFEMARLKSAVASGFGEDDPRIKALRESTQTKFALMESTVENYKINLKLNIDNATKMLEAAKAVAEGKTTDAVAERARQSEYAAAKYNYESQLQRLNILREHATRAEAQVSVLPLEK